jgi:hypothetical protein
MTVSDFLVWLAGGGSLIAASWVLGQFSWYTTLVEKAKQWIFFAIAVLFGGGAYAVTQYVSQTALNAVAPYFLIVSFVFIAIFVNKTYTKISNMLKTLESLKK